MKKGTLLHGTYRNIEGLKNIVDEGLIASVFTNGRLSKYPSCVGVWNIKNDCTLSDYINFYSGGTIKYNGLLVNEEYLSILITLIFLAREFLTAAISSSNKYCSMRRSL